MKILTTLISVLPLCASILHAQGEIETISLAGKWHVRLDRRNAGIAERWFAQRLDGSIHLPGSLQGAGMGDPVTVETKWTGDILDSSWFKAPQYEKYRQPGNIKIPFWLQPNTTYSGVAWYQREFSIPPGWREKRLVLTLERPHWETRVWIDEKEAGSNNSLSTPHAYDLGSLTPGTHRVTVRVDNGPVLQIGVNSHSISDQTQGNWNGIVGSIAITATPRIWIDDLRVYPHVATGSVTVKGSVGNGSGKPGVGTLRLLLAPAKGGKAVCTTTLPLSWDPSGGVFSAELTPRTRAKLWDEFSPTLYRVSASLAENASGGAKREAANRHARTHSASVTFGFREVATEGTEFLINGRKLFFRGTLECAIFPKTGHPPTDVPSWKRIIRAAKSHGLNLFRFHSWCPPEAAFTAADELGFYFHVEAASWANPVPTLGDGLPVDRWVMDESARILHAYGNHPSFLLFAYGNEPGGERQKDFLGKWLATMKGTDPRRLYTCAAGWPELPENQFHVTYQPRIQLWGAGLKSRINGRPPETQTDYREFVKSRTVPVISHEIGQWCVFPNFAEIPKYTGYLKPKNFEIFRDFLNARQMGEQAGEFLLASGKLQVLCYKEEIESALRTPGMGGFELLDLHDFPGQGTALVGMLDPFWEPKGYVTAKEVRRFCNSTVLLARMSKRVYTSSETFEAELECAHYGPAPLSNAVTYWKLVDGEGKIILQGSHPPRTIPLGNGIRLGRNRVDLRGLPAPGRYTLIAGFKGTEFENDWDFWVYPASGETPSSDGVLIAKELNGDAVSRLKEGGKVILLIPPERVRGDARGKVALGFSSIFWNTSWTSRQAPHTLGILCDPAHPALGGFPTESHSNWQWWYLIHNAGAMILDSLPAGVQPIVQVIDDWFTSRKLGLVFEASVGSGKLLVCSIDLQSEENPVARQMLKSLLDYAGSNRFAPRVLVTLEEVRELMEDRIGP